MVQPDWPEDLVPLALDTAPVPAYGSASLADLLPTIASGQGVPGLHPPSRSSAPPTGSASS